MKTAQAGPAGVSKGLIALRPGKARIAESPRRESLVLAESPRRESLLRDSAPFSQPWIPVETWPARYRGSKTYY